MDLDNKIEEIIKNGKWVQNYVGNGKVQCIKLVKDAKELLVIIASSTLSTPISCRVEKILIVHGEIIVFYDGEYPQRVEKGEYNRYRNFLNENEWKVIFEEGPVKGLLEKHLVSKEKSFYAEMHETLEEYMKSEYDTEASEFLCNKYNL
jgi:hypothetical protein